MARASKKDKTLEQSFEELEQIVRQLESEELSLEDSFLIYQNGMKLLKKCNESIDRVEKQLIILNENEDGNETKHSMES